MSFLDAEHGKRRFFNRRFERQTDAAHWVKTTLRDIERNEGRAALNEAKTFAQLADYYEANYLHEPEYVAGRRVAGLRSWKDQRRRVTILRQHFGSRRIQAITYGAVLAFRKERLATPVTMAINVPKEARTAKRPGAARAAREKKSVARSRTVATVNRELALLRRMLEIAHREGWIVENPFRRGDSLISTADEHQRQRILSVDEERVLLAACETPGTRRKHLRAILICALDTGMRRGEMFRLRWADIDFATGAILVRAENTKTLRSRLVHMTTRMLVEMRRLAVNTTPTDLVFGITDTVKTAWGGLRRAAGLPDLRFHDLRHTAASRLARSGMALAEIGRLLGHTQPQTTYRYVNADSDTARRAAAALSELAAVSVSA